MKSSKLSAGIKNVADIVKKADNLELYAMLLDLQSKALELQEKILSSNSNWRTEAE